MMSFLSIILQLNLISDIEVDIELPTGYLALRGIYIIGAWPVSRYPVSRLGQEEMFNRTLLLGCYDRL